MEAKRHPKINVFLGRFSDASGNIDGTAAGPRLEPQVSHFLQPTPQGGAILSKNIVQKQAKTGLVKGSSTPWAVGPANFCLLFHLYINV